MLYVLSVVCCCFAITAGVVAVCAMAWTDLRKGKEVNIWDTNTAKDRKL
jgi:hypothetical protein